MMKFLHELSACADSASIEDWSAFADLTPADRASRRQELRDPLLASSGKFDHVFAICGFMLDGEGVNLVYFWHESLHQQRISSLSANNDIMRFLDFFLALSLGVKSTPSLSEASSYPRCKESIAHIRSYYGDDVDLVWYIRGERVFVAVVGNSTPISSVIANRVRSMTWSDTRSPMTLLACHFEFFLHRSPLSVVAPTLYISRLIGQNADRAKAVLIDPRYFTPWISLEKSSFAWPWQKCMAGDSKTGTVTHKSIPTCSLVFDLRRSYLAMELLRQDRATSYAAFIKSVVKMARVAIGSWGGYFDKETGDGIVAHFVNSSALGDFEDLLGIEERAFGAAREIIECVDRLCRDFQENLIFEVVELGASVGIHNGTATWIYSGDRVIAVGDSVVIATRLCGEAPPHSIFVSASVFNSLKSCLPLEEAGRFERRRYHSKEFNDRSELFGFCHI